MRKCKAEGRVYKPMIRNDISEEWYLLRVLKVEKSVKSIVMSRAFQLCGMKTRNKKPQVGERKTFLSLFSSVLFFSIEDISVFVCVLNNFSTLSPLSLPANIRY